MSPMPNKDKYIYCSPPPPTWSPTHSSQLATSACLTIRVYTFVRHEPYTYARATTVKNYHRGSQNVLQSYHKLTTYTSKHFKIFDRLCQWNKIIKRQNTILWTKYNFVDKIQFRGQNTIPWTKL